MKTELRGGPKDGDTVDAPPLREARLIDFPDMGAYGVHRYEIVATHAVQYTSWSTKSGDEFWQVAKYVGYFPLPSP